jgi:hypothetical protein
MREFFAPPDFPFPTAPLQLLCFMKSWLALLLLAAPALHAQFSNAWLHDKYWNDGKAEFDLYEGMLVREGVPQPAQVTHIYVREPFDPKQLVKSDDGSPPNVLKLNQVIQAQTGIYVCQQMHSSFWDVHNGSLLKWSLTSADSCGNTFKIVERNRPHEPINMHGAEVTNDRPPSEYDYGYFTYWDGMASGQEHFDLEQPKSVETAIRGAIKNKKALDQSLFANRSFFYDELPMRVRTLDFSKDGKPLDILLAASVINSKKDNLQFQPATIGFTKSDEQIVVVVKWTKGTDTFTLAPKFPYRLRHWQMADGGELTLKHSYKIAYWKFGKPGGREAAMATHDFAGE